MTHIQKYKLFRGLYLLSFAVVLAWVLLLVIGLFQPAVMAVANRIAIPLLVGSVLCSEIFKRLAARNQTRISA